MSHAIRSRTYDCLNDCQRSGCPGHSLEVDLCRSMDTVTLRVDGKNIITLDQHAWEAAVHTWLDLDCLLAP